MARESRAQLGPVSTEGDAVRARRERIGLSVVELAKLAQVSRDTISAIEAGEGFRRTSLSKIERALTASEEEHGLAPMLAPSQPDVVAEKTVVTIQVGDATVTYEGSVENLSRYTDEAARLLAAVQAESQSESSDG